MAEIPRPPYHQIAAYIENKKKFDTGLRDALRMEPSRDLCTTLLSSAEENAKDESKKGRTKKILQLASLFIKETWDDEAKKGTVDTALMKNFEETVNLQEYVGDTRGARETVGFIVPRLTAYESTAGKPHDDAHAGSADALKEKCIRYIDNDASLYHKRLLDSIAAEDRRKKIVGETAVKKVRVGDIDAAVQDVQQYGADHQFVSSVFPYLHQSIEEGNSENAACIFDRVLEEFPDEFTGDNTSILAQKNAIPVLITVEREELLASMIVDSFASDRGNVDKYHKSIAYAMHAGAHYASYDHTPTSFRGFLQLLPPDHKSAAEESYRTSLTARFHRRAS